MPDSLITLTTDFGESSPYAAAVKGVILGVNPAARLLDLSHQVPPQDVRHAAFFLADSIPYFPPGVIHVVVVDPGVGSDRALLYIDLAGHRLLAPDNGCWTLLADAAPRPPAVRRLAEPRFWRPAVSATFHGRDILGPVAGHLSRGVPPEALGPAFTEWVRLKVPAPELRPDALRGEVVFIDRFGNLITNIPGEAFRAFAGGAARVSVGDTLVPRRVRTYAEAEPGAVVALIGSAERLEVAVTCGNAAQRLGAKVGTPVTVTRE